MKELKGIDENTVIHCETYEEWFQVLKACEFPEYLVRTGWNHRDPCILFQKGNWYKGDLGYYQENGYTTITATEFLILNTEPETPAIPERWCVRRTPENAEVLNAWARSKNIGLEQDNGYVGYDGDFYYMPDLPEITFEQWQTIPEHAEWLEKRYQETKEDFIKQMEKQVSEVEEREIIGRVVPMDLYGGAVKDGDIVTKSKHWNAYETAGMGINPKYYFPCEIAEAWQPYYKIEKPVFKVGDWVTVEDGFTKTFQVHNFTDDGDLISKNDTWGKKFCRLATPEEIEAARPREIWERYPTWESLQFITTYTIAPKELPFASAKAAIAGEAFAMLSQLEKAWNEGKKGSWTVSLVNGNLATRQTLTYSAQINFASETLAEKSLELHGDLWRKYHMA